MRILFTYENLIDNLGITDYDVDEIDEYFGTNAIEPLDGETYQIFATAHSQISSVLFNYRMTSNVPAIDDVENITLSDYLTDDMNANFNILTSNNGEMIYVIFKARPSTNDYDSLSMMGVIVDEYIRKYGGDLLDDKFTHMRETLLDMCF